MRYKISYSSSNKRERDRVSSEIAERSRVYGKTSAPSKSSLSYRLLQGSAIRRTIGRDSQWRVSDAKRTNVERSNRDPGWTRTNRSCKSSPRKRTHNKGKTRPAYSRGSSGSCMPAPDDRDKSNFVVVRH